jgi:hypothetical protein
MSKLAKSYKPEMDAPYFDRGQYLFEVMLSKANARGEPYLNFKCIGSHDGRRINSYYGMNFFVEAESSAQKALHVRLLSSLLNALDIKELDDMEQIPVGTKVVAFFSKGGFSPLASFSAPEKFTGYTSKPAQNTGGDLPPPDIYNEFAPSDEDLDAFFEDPFPELLGTVQEHAA